MSYTTKTVIEGHVTRSAAGKLQIEGSVAQDDTRLGMHWPDNPVRMNETTIPGECHLSCYEGQKVRVTVERLAAAAPTSAPHEPVVIVLD